MELTELERQELLKSARNASQALAEFWDVSRNIELAHDIEFDGTTDFIENLAAGLGFPPKGENILESDVIDGFLALEIDREEEEDEQETDTSSRA